MKLLIGLKDFILLIFGTILIGILFKLLSWDAKVALYEKLKQLQKI